MAKICSCGCGGPVFSKGLCKKAWQRAYGKPINKVGARLKERLKVYRPARDQFLLDNPVCQIQYAGCTYTATEVHHAEGRENDKLTDIRGFVATCHSCHQHANEHSAEAISTGASKSRHKK